MGEVDIQKLAEEVENLKKENALLKQILTPSALINEISSLHKKIDALNKNPLQNELEFQFKRHKKSIIKQKVLDLLQQYPLAEVKGIIVNQMKYCSKASFYRYAEELKKENKIEYIHDYYNSTSHIFGIDFNFNLWVLPLISAIVLVAIIPFLTNWMYDISLKFQAKRLELKQSKIET